MFLVGLELNPELLRGSVRATVAISHASIVAAVRARRRRWRSYLYPRLSTSDVPFTSFALFLGVAMSITAFPGAGAHPDGPRMTRTELGVAGAGLRGHRRRDGLVSAGVRRRRRAGDAGQRAGGRAC